MAGLEGAAAERGGEGVGDSDSDGEGEDDVGACVGGGGEADDPGDVDDVVNGGEDGDEEGSGGGEAGRVRVRHDCRDGEAEAEGAGVVRAGGES